MTKVFVEQPALHRVRNKWLLLDVKLKTIFLDVKKFKGQKKEMYFNKKNPDLFGYKTIDIIY